MKRILIPIALLVLLVPALGASTYYDAGSQMFTITAGPYFEV